MYGPGCGVEGHQNATTALSVRAELAPASVRSFGADDNGGEPGVRATESDAKSACESLDLRLAVPEDPNRSPGSAPATFSASHQKLAASRWRVGGGKACESSSGPVE